VAGGALAASGAPCQESAFAMKHTIETGLELADSKRAIDKAMQAYSERFAEYSPRFSWKTANAADFGFTAKGVDIAGTMLVHDHKVDVEMNVPFLFRIFQGRAMAVVTEQVELWVGRVKRGEV
jgi:hypothetical protein